MHNVTRPSSLSILIPFQRDQHLFEETLLSVLENRPKSSQIIAVHNGTYTDPFELGDEIDFATARSSNLVDLLRDGFESVEGEIVHILGPGFRAHEGWASSALDALDDDDVAAVDVLLDVDEEVIPAGWYSTAGRLCQSYRETGGSPSNGECARGVHLDAAFFRTSVLRELLQAVAPAMNDPVACAFTFGCLLQVNDWKVAAASHTRVDGSLVAAYEEDSDAARGERLAAIERRILGRTSLSRLPMIREAIFGWSSPGEWFGTMKHKSMLPAMRRQIDPTCVSAPTDTSPMPEMDAADPGLSRAA